MDFKPEYVRCTWSPELEAKEAYSFYRTAKLPKGVGLEYNDGFRCSLTDAGMRRHFGAFMKEE